MRKMKFVFLVIFLVFLVQLVFYYRGVYFPPKTQAPDFLDITVNSSGPVQIHDSFAPGEGTVLIDMTHENNAGDLNLLISQIIARGFRVEYLKDKGDMMGELSASSSFVVIAPHSSFTSAEVQNVKEFVDRGGRLLLLSEPVNTKEMNSLAIEFGILFWDDYLYNVRENEGNFKHIYLTEFAEHDITRGLEKVVLYTASSVYGNGIIFTNSDTHSSSSGEKGRFSVAVSTNDAKVLAIGDVTFISEPYNVLDNNRLIFNIADFLTPPAPPQEEIINASNESIEGNGSANMTINMTN